MKTTKKIYGIALALTCSLAATLMAQGNIVSFGGYQWQALGQAQLTVTTNGLQVSNVGSSGQDGVQLLLPNGIPTNSTLNVDLASLGAVTNYPVGAFMQETPLGTINGVSGQVISTLTATETTSGLAMDFDASNLAPSSLTANFYDQGALVFSESNSVDWLLATSRSGITPMPTVWDVDNQEFWQPLLQELSASATTSMGWGIPQVFSLTTGSNSVVADNIDLGVEGATNTFEGYSAINLTASQIPSFTITGVTQTVSFGGYQWQALGQAQLTVTTNGLQVSNVGSSGLDGVQLLLPNGIPTNSTLNVDLASLGAVTNYPVGAFMQETPLGTINGVSSQVISTLSATETTSGLAMDFDASNQAPSSLTANFYDQGALVFSESNSVDWLLATTRSGIAPWPAVWDVDNQEFWQPLLGEYSASATSSMGWGIAQVVSPTSGSNSVVADNIDLGVEGATNTFAGYSAINLTASQIPSFTITGVTQTVSFGGYQWQTLGQAQLTVTTKGLQVSNVGSSGQDGVQLLLPGGIPTDSMFNVHLASLGAVTNYPVGAFMQETSLGTINGAANQVLGTLSATATTNGLTMNLDTTNLAPSSLIANYYLQGALVLSESNISPNAFCFLPSSIPNNFHTNPFTPPEWPGWDADCFWIQDDFYSASGDWDDPLLFSTTFGGNFVVADSVDLIPQGVTNTIAGYSAMNLTASQIPAFTITGVKQTVSFGGYQWQTLGQAQLSIATNGLQVSNIGSSGQDGVQLVLPSGIPTNSMFNVHLASLGAVTNYPVGAFMQETSLGTINGVANQVLGTLSATATTNGLTMNFDTANLAPSSLIANYYLQGALVLSESNIPPDAFCFMPSNPNNNHINPFTPPVWPGWDADCLWIMDDFYSASGDWDDPLFFSSTFAGNSVVADSVDLIPQGVTNTIAEYSDMSLTASQIPSFTITGVTTRYARLTNQGLNYTALGSAELELAANEFLYISNLSSGGQDGVSIGLPTNAAGLVAQFQDPDPSNSLPVGAYIQSQLVGTANGVTNGVLGTLTETKEGTDDYVLSPNFSPLGATNCTVQAYLQGVLVFQTNNSITSFGIEITNSITTWDEERSNNGIGIQNSFGILTAGFATPVSVSVAGQFVVCDHLAIIPENVTFANAPTAFQIVASQVPLLTINAVEVSPLLLNWSEINQVLTLRWYGTAVLQQSTDLVTWTDNTNAVNSYTIPPDKGVPVKFYRLIFRP